MMIQGSDSSKYAGLFDSGQDAAAFALFFNEYIEPSTDKLTAAIQSKMKLVLDGASAAEVSKIVLSISSATSKYERRAITLFTEFTKDIYSPALFKRLKITDPKLKNAILQKTLSEFAEKTRGALANTNSSVLSSIRRIQEDMIKANLKIAAREQIPGVLKKEVAAFKRQLLADVEKNNPQFYKIMNEGKIIKSRTLPDGSYHSYTLQNYAEMSVETTLLNVQRDAVEIAALSEGAPVIGYKLINNRTLKGKEREVCQHILGKKVRGMVILALNQEAADTLGVMTLDEARKKGAMGVGCRHGLAPLDTEYLIQVEKVILLKGLTPETKIITGAIS